MQAVAAHPHATADEITADARDTIGTISRQSVYDSLGTLTEAGLVRRIQPSGSPARFEDRVRDNHHHLICRNCGDTRELSASVVEEWTYRVGAEHGFSDISHVVDLFGTCERCRASTPVGG